MRLTQVLLKQSHRFRLKQLWRTRGLIKDVTPTIPEYIRKKGVPVTSAIDIVTEKPKFEKYTPPVPDDPRYLDSFPAPPEEHPDFHSQPVYEFKSTCRLTEGLQQACVLTKTQTFTGLPPTVEECIGETGVPVQDKLIPRYIMQANVWDPTKEKLPRRYNESIPGWKFKAEFGIPQAKITSILIRRLVRLCQMIGARHPKFHPTLAVSHDHPVSALFSHGENADKHIRVETTLDTLISSSQPLPEFASEELVDSSVHHKLPDLYPVAPTIDFVKQHIYKPYSNTGWRDGFSHPYPHLLFVPYHNDWSLKENLAVGLLVAHAQSLATAQQIYGSGAERLAAPISTQCVLTNGSMFHFICYQLNTLHTNKAAGIKNQAWIDADNLLYRKVEPKRAMLRNTVYEDYDPQVFEKLLAMFVTGGDLGTELMPGVKQAHG